MCSQRFQKLLMRSSFVSLSVYDFIHLTKKVVNFSPILTDPKVLVVVFFHSYSIDALVFRYYIYCNYYLYGTCQVLANLYKDTVFNLQFKILHQSQWKTSLVCRKYIVKIGLKSSVQICFIMSSVLVLTKPRMWNIPILYSDTKGSAWI